MLKVQNVMVANSSTEVHRVVHIPEEEDTAPAKTVPKGTKNSSKTYETPTNHHDSQLLTFIFLQLFNIVLNDLNTLLCIVQIHIHRKRRCYTTRYWHVPST